MMRNAWAAGLLLACALSLAGAEPPERSAADYARDLGSTDRNLRREAAYQLSRMGRGARVALPELIRTLEDDQQQVWFGGITALANLGPDAEPALPALLGELQAWQPFRKDRQGAQALYRTALALGSIGAAAVPSLSNALASDKWFVRAGAAKALGFAGEPAGGAAPALVRLLEDERAEVRDAAGETLALLRLPVVAPVVQLLEGAQEPQSRLAAANTLKRLGTNALHAAPSLRLALTSDPDVGVRAEALEALTRCGLPAAELLPALWEAAQDADATVHQAGFRQLLLVRPVSVLYPRLTAGLRSPDAAERNRATALITELGAEAGDLAPVLTERLRAGVGGDTPADPGLARALGGLGPAGVVSAFGELAGRRAGSPGTNDWALAVLRQTTSLAVPVLAEGLTHRAPAVRAGALVGLGSPGVLARSVARRITPLLEDPEPAVRAAAWSAAAACGVPPQALLDHLERGLNDTSPEVRRAALGAMAVLGPAAKPAVPLLMAGLDTRDEELGVAAVRAIAALGGEASSAVEPLARRLPGAPAALQVEILHALGAIGGAAASALPEVTPLSSASSALVRQAFAVAVGGMRESGASALAALITIARDPEATVRAAALSALSAVGPATPEALQAITAALEDPEVGVRRAAAGAVGALGEKGRGAEERLFAMLGVESDRAAAGEALRAIHPTSVRALIAALEQADWTVRQMAADALARLGKASREAVPVLERVMREDRHEEVKGAARRALRRIREG